MTRVPGHLRLPGCLHVACVVAVLTAACASTGGVPHPDPRPGGTAARTQKGDGTLVATALALQGVPYRNGGADPSGFDCSGFTQYVFARHGIALPRAVEEQYELGSRVKLREVASGDLVFFKTVSRGPSHVGIVVGDDQFIHAPSSRGVVRVERLSADYWSRRFLAARRIH
jgi:cell wall-associated NlpC family hydrolase